MGNRSKGSRAARGSRVQRGQGVQVGRNNVQYNLFAGPPPPGPVVAGSIPQAPPAWQPREDLMARLRAAGPGVSVVRAVTGMRGVGKTQLAAAYARECINQGWRLVAWINAEDNAGIANGLAVVADRLDISKPGSVLGTLGTEVRNRLEADGDRCLVVFDNVTELEAVRPYVPAAGRAQVLITSTDTTVSTIGRPLAVDVFSEDESLEFLAERTHQQDPGGASELAGELGHLPLALAQAAAVIQAQRMDYPAYLDRFRRYPVQKYLPSAKNDPYPRGVAEAIMLAIDTIAAADSTGLCGELLLMVSLLSPDGVSRDLLQLAGSTRAVAAGRRSHAGFRRRGLVEVPSAEEIDVALGQLADTSLLTFSQDEASPAPLVTAHRLVRRVVRERAEHQAGQDAAARRICAMLKASADSVQDARQHRRLAREFVRHTIALHGYLTTQAGKVSRPLADAMLTLRGRALHCQCELGDNAMEAIALGEPLVEDCGRRLGGRHPDTRNARINLAWAYSVAGRAGDAIVILERTLEDGIRLRGTDHPETLSSRNSLAHAYRRAGRTDEAVSLFEVNLASRVRVHGEDHVDTLVAQGNLGDAYRSAGRKDEAVALLERTVADDIRVIGDEHPTTLYAQAFLASAYQSAGRREEALALFERARSGMRRSLGDDHPDTLATTNNLAVEYAAAGQVREAVSLAEQILPGARRVLGEEHPTTVAVRQSLARFREMAAKKGRPRR